MKKACTPPPTFILMNLNQFLSLIQIHVQSHPTLKTTTNKLTFIHTKLPVLRRDLSSSANSDFLYILLYTNVIPFYFVSWCTDARSLK